MDKFTDGARRIKNWSFLLIFAVCTQAPAGLWDDFNDSLDSLESGIRSACARFLVKKKGIQSKKEILHAAKSGEALFLTAVNTYLPYHIHNMIYPIVLGQIYDRKFLLDLLKTGDNLYAYHGKMFRIRPSNSSVVEVPESLLYYMPGGYSNVSDRHLELVRLSWPMAFLFPHRPELLENYKFFAASYAEWSKSPGAIEFRVLLKAQRLFELGGYLTLRVVFKEDVTELFLERRVHYPVDELRRPWLDQALSQFASDDTHGLAELFKLTDSGRPMVVQRADTSRVLSAISNLHEKQPFRLSLHNISAIGNLHEK